MRCEVLFYLPHVGEKRHVMHNLFCWLIEVGTLFEAAWTLAKPSCEQ
jgi:hypothetical protein